MMRYTLLYAYYEILRAFHVQWKALIFYKTFSDKEDNNMDANKKAGELINKVRAEVPLVHCITNYVTVNDVANALLAIGASPIMSDDCHDVEDIVSISKALVINIGTLNERTIASMILAGKKANALHIPVILDPVGAGASAYRNETTKKIIEEVKLTVLRGNLSEVSFVAGLEVSTKGVDSSEQDADKDAVAVARSVAKQLNCTVAITGAVDTISDGETVLQIENGHPMLSKVTGTGCLTSGLVGAFVAVGENPVYASAAAIAATGIAGELAFAKAGATGTGSFHIALIDALSQICENTYMEMGKITQL